MLLNGKAKQTPSARDRFCEALPRCAAQLSLVDACGAAYRCHRGETLATTQQGGSIDIVKNKLIVAIGKPLGHLVAIGKHTLNVELQRGASLALQLLEAVGGKYHRPRYVVTKACGEILVTPRHVYGNCLHFPVVLLLGN